jgi:hypothetical protein
MPGFIFIIIAAVVVAVLVIVIVKKVAKPSASKGGAKKEGADPNVPEWAGDTPPDNVIWGIGIAKMANPMMGMGVSEQRGRAAVAEQLYTIAHTLVTANGENTDQAAVIQGYFSKMNINLSGSRSIKRWSGKDGSFWSLVEFDKENAKTAIAGILKDFEENTKISAQKALAAIDAELAKPIKPVQKSN